MKGFLVKYVAIPLITLAAAKAIIALFCAPPSPFGWPPGGLDLVDWLVLALGAVTVGVLALAAIVDRALRIRMIARRALPRLQTARAGALDRSYRAIWLERRLEIASDAIGLLSLMPANDNAKRRRAPKPKAVRPPRYRRPRIRRTG
jgi:hypothetical protein